MPSWVADKPTWAKAKKAVLPDADKYDSPYAVITSVYKKMGGTVKPGSEDEVPEAGASDLAKVGKLLDLAAANSASSSSQLDRSGSRKLEAKESIEAAFSAVDAGSRKVRVRIIIEGPGNETDRHWYSAQAIQDGVQKFAGARAFLNHQTVQEADERPEQDVTLLAGFYSNLAVGRAFNVKLGTMVSSLEADFTANSTEAGDTALALARAQILWQQTYPDMPGECHAAISINSGGWSDGVKEYNGEEWTNVVAFEDVRSADIVTRPGAGGAFVSLTESLSGEPGITQETAMKKKLQKLALALETAAYKAKTEKDPQKKALAEAAKKKAQEEFNVALQAHVEAEKKREAEGGEEETEDEDEDADADPASAMNALKAHVPQHDGENDQQYADRLSAIQKHASGAGVSAAPGEGETEDETEDEDMPTPPAAGAAPKVAGKESRRARESAVVAKFRKESPMLYRELMNQARETFGAERADFKTLKSRLDALESENRSLRLERDLGACERMITESGIPTEYLAAGDLIKLDESGRKREIARIKLVMESAGGARVFSGERAASGGAEEFSNMREANFGTPKN